MLFFLVIFHCLVLTVYCNQIITTFDDLIVENDHLKNHWILFTESCNAKVKQQWHSSGTSLRLVGIVKNDNIANWINFNVELSEIKNLKNPNLFMFILTIIGAILGSFYVLISSNFNQRK